MEQAITGIILPDPFAGPCRARSSAFPAAFPPAAFLAASRRPSLLGGGMLKVELCATRDHV